MTRINAGVHPEELPDKLLLAEHREITRIPNAVASGLARMDLPIPDTFRLGPGHVRFFYNKLTYLFLRYLALYNECLYRGFNVTFKGNAWDTIPTSVLEWRPTTEDRKLIIERITSRGFSLLSKKDYDHAETF